MEAKKAFGLVTALGTKLGEKARTDGAIVDRLKATTDAASFRSEVRALAAGLVPDALLRAFTDEVVTDADWLQWRSRLVLQLKMVRDGGKPAPGHEAGKGVRKSG